MLAQIRAFAKSPFSAVLIGLLIVSFGVWGVRDVFKGRLSNDVVQAGPRHVGPADFKRDFENFKKQIEKQAGQPITNEVAVQNHFDVRVAEEIATRESFAAMIDKIGIRPSDALVKTELEKIPAFFDQVSGRFDKTQYQTLLGRNGLTPQRFEAQLRDEVAQSQVGAGLMNGLRVPRAYSGLGAVFMMEARDISYFPLDPKTVPQPALPTDPELAKFMQDNAQALMKPEFRILTVVRFSPALVGANLPIDEAELKKRFEFRKDTLSKPETRSLVQIPVKDAKSAEAVSARLAKGEDPQAIARSLGVDAILYADKPRTAVADAKVAEAAFSMKPGAITTVQSTLGTAVVKLDKVSPGKAVTLEEIRPQLEAELRKDAAAEKVYALSQKYDDAHSGGASLPEAAQKAGVPTVTIGPVSAQGADPQNQPVGGVNPKLIQTAFGLPAGGESEVQDAGNGEFYAVRVEKIIPKALPQLAEVKAQLTKVWMAREVSKRLQAKADDLLARIKKGESMEAVAASVGSHVEHVNGLDRQTAGQNKDLSQEALGQAFSVKPGEAFAAQNAKAFGVIVGKLDAIRPPTGETLARVTEGSRPQMTQAIFREISGDARKAARDLIKPKIYPDQARLALGLEPVDSKGKPKGLAQ
jgi:peptidyl-prolyl cis-trans isomerase D